MARKVLFNPALRKHLSVRHNFNQKNMVGLWKSIKYQAWKYWVSYHIFKNIGLVNKKMSHQSVSQPNQKYSNLVDLVSDLINSSYSNKVCDVKIKPSYKEEAKSLTDRLVTTFNKNVTNPDDHWDFFSFNITTHKTILKEKIGEENRGLYFFAIRSMCNLFNSHSVSTQNTLLKKIRTQKIGGTNIFFELIECIELYVNTTSNMSIKRKYSKRTFLSPSTQDYLKLSKDWLDYLLIRVEKLYTKYQLNFDTEKQTKVYYNLVNMYIHFVLVQKKITLSDKEFELIFVASALHPAQDDYIDKSEIVSDKIINLLIKKLKGEYVDNNSIDDKNILPVFNMIDYIYFFYNPKKHKNLVEIFSSLNNWQIASLKQKDGTLSNSDDLLSISFNKGGYAFCFFAYIACGKMSVKQFRHFFSAGAIFQIIDDLGDIEEDIMETTQTVWTNYVKQDLVCDEVLVKLTALQREYEKIVGECEEFKYSSILRYFEMFCVRHEILRFFIKNEKYFSDTMATNIDKNSFVRIKNMKKYFKYF